MFSFSKKIDMVFIDKNDRNTIKTLGDAVKPSETIKPINDYIKTEESVNFYTLMESAKRRGDTAIGYRINSLIHNQDAAYGVVINPKKDDYIQFTDLDKIIVLSEEG